MSKLKAYPKYKDSGIEWIGEVPEGWETNRVYSLFEETSARGGSKDSLLTVTQSQGILPQSLYQENTGRRLSQQMSEDYSNYKQIRKGDFVYNKMRMWQGAIGVSSYDGCVSPAYVSMRPKKTIASAYWGFLFTQPLFLVEVNKGSQGICDDQNSCTFDKFREIHLPIPSLPEQQAIAAYLDRETAQIDALIAKKTRSIELLREKRQAMITHAVTKGLNPNAKMKDSGIEWIGEVPEGWEITPVKHLSMRIKTGATPNSFTDEAGDNIIPWYAPGDFFDFLRIKKSSKMVSVFEDKVSAYSTNTILVVGIGATLGKLALAPEPCFANQQINFIVPNIRKVSPYFLVYSLFAQIDQMKYLANASTIGIMNQEKTGSIILASPPLPEQQSIAAYLDDKCAVIDTLITKTERSIELLKEKRQALITAAVTGKIDVREAAPEAVC